MDAERDLKQRLEELVASTLADSQRSATEFFDSVARGERWGVASGYRDNQGRERRVLARLD